MSIVRSIAMSGERGRENFVPTFPDVNVSDMATWPHCAHAASKTGHVCDMLSQPPSAFRCCPAECGAPKPGDRTYILDAILTPVIYVTYPDTLNPKP